VKQFQAKIGLDNIASIQMFQKLGFREISRSEVFNEVTLAATSNDEAFVRYMKDHLVQYSISHHYCEWSLIFCLMILRASLKFASCCHLP
jgi:L-amino acid N-acyltransferase YncA